MPKPSSLADTDAVNSEIYIAAPPERVFQALTDESQLVRWFRSPECPVKLWQMDARPGGSYRYANTVAGKSINGVSDFQCHGEIVEMKPPSLLVYSWIANWHLDPSLRTIVRWELTPVAGGTQVKVTHSGLASEDTARKDYNGGWPGVLAMLKKFAEN